LTSTGAPHVAFLNGSLSTTSSSYSVIHGVRGASTWALNAVASVSSSSNDNPRYDIAGVSMAIGLGDTPFVGYRRNQHWNTGSNNYNFYVARASGATWTTDNVDSVGNTYSGGLYAPITLRSDGTGRVHASFHKCCVNNYYAWPVYGVRDLAGTWALEDLDMAERTSLAVEPSGTPHALVSDSGLVLRTKSGTTWNSSTVSQDFADTAYSDVRNSALALDSNAVPHVCYQSNSGGKQPVHAFWSSNQWITEVVDAAPNTGEYCALALDSNNNLLLCYRDATQADVKCARKAAGGWISSAVASTGDVGQGMDLAFDAQNRAHLVYFDDSQKAWMYLH
jgi:hypothetical protein